MRKLILAIWTLSFFHAGIAQNIPDDYLKGRAMLSLSQYDSAIVFFTRAIEKKSDNLDAYYYRGMAYFDSRQYNPAISDFMLVNKRYRGKASLMLAKTECRLNHTDLAIKYVREHLESSYREPEKILLLDPDLDQLTSTRAWKELWKEKDWYSTYDEELQEAIYLVHSKEYPDALNHLNNLEKKGFKSSQVHLYKAMVFLATNNDKAGLNELDQSLKADRRNVEALEKRLQIYMESGNYEDALKDCNSILQLEPAAFKYYIIAGDLKGKTGKYNQGVADVEFYLKLFPEDHAAYHALGDIHYEAGKYISALPCYNKALELDNGIAGYYYSRGRAYAATGTLQYAEKDFSMALDLDPLDADTWYEKGLVDSKLGNNEKACFDFRKAARYGKYEAVDYINKLCGGGG